MASVGFVRDGISLGVYLRQGIIYGVIDFQFEDIDVVLGLVNIHLAIFTNPLKLVGIYRVLESAHVICNLSNKHFSRCKKTNLLWNTQV